MSSSAELYAASHLIGRECAGPNKQFLLCKKADPNPAACLASGEKVTSCAVDL